MLSFRRYQTMLMKSVFIDDLTLRMQLSVRNCHCCQLNATVLWASIDSQLDLLWEIKHNTNVQAWIDCEQQLCIQQSFGFVSIRLHFIRSRALNSACCILFFRPTVLFIIGFLDRAVALRIWALQSNITTHIFYEDGGHGIQVMNSERQDTPDRWN